ncbi:MAG: alpha/beta hydrolase [Pseudonocardia sp.]
MSERRHASSAVRIVVRELAPAVGIGRRRLKRHPAWTDTGGAPGNGLGVVVVPGFGGVDASMAVLRRWLRARDYRPVGAELGLNLGCTSELVARLERRMELHARATDGPVVLIGHSRGGWLGRLVAVRRPDLVRGLVMLGSPVLNPLGARAVVRLAGRALVGLSALGVRGVLDRDCMAGTCGDATVAGLAAPLLPDVPAVSFYSRSDGVVRWELCLDPAAECVEVGSSHAGMGIDPDFYAALAPRLATWATTS